MSKKPLTKKFQPIYLLYGLLAFIIVSILSFSIFKPIKVLPRISLAPGYALTNQDNESRTSEHYRGKLTLYTFTYTNCDGDCPDVTSQMQDMRVLLDEVASDTVEYALVTVTLDPERDTPEALNLFAAPYLDASAQDVTWDFITGDPLRMKYMTGGGFGLFYEPVTDPNIANDYEINFYPRFILVDGWGIVRSEYRTATLNYDEVLEDIQYLTDEVSNSQGAAKYAYEAAHLFRCYP
jgi:protein SCO1/2